MAVPIFAPLQIPPLNFNMSNKSGDIMARNGFGASGLDGSGWTVNMRTSGNASGATQQRPSLAQTLSAGSAGAMGELNNGGIPWMLIIGGLLVWKLAK